MTKTVAPTGARRSPARRRGRFSPKRVMGRLWERGATEAAQNAGVSPSRLPDAYAESLHWARELSRVLAVAA